MPRLSRLAPFALLALLLLAPLADAGETKEFSDQNFKLTVPDGWRWMDVRDEMKKTGYVLRTGRRKGEATAIADVRVAPANDLTLKELTDEVRTQMGQGFKNLQGSKIVEGKLSGLEGTQVIFKGIARTDQKLIIRVYSIQAEGKFHQLIMQLYEGAETRLAREVDAVRRGYRLLEGAGPEEGEPNEEALEEEADVGELGSADNWPEKGPGREGNTVVFPTHNLRWTTPEGSPFTWERIVPDEAADLPEKGARLMMTARASKERKPSKEGDPTQNQATIVLVMANQEAGYDANRIATSDNVKNGIAEQFFDEVMMARTKSFEDVEIGNATGAALRMAGRKGNNAVYVWYWFIGLRGKLYEFRAIVAGGREANDVFKEAIKKLMEGIEFPETLEPVAGPMGISSVPAFSEQRGKDVGKEKKITSVGFTATKPEGVYVIDFDPQHGTPNLRLAWETRSEDGQQYLYFDAQSYPTQPGARDPEGQLLSQREGQWRDAVDGAKIISKGKTAGFKDKWGKAKGLGYEFTGTYRDKPYTERGWIVTYKKYTYWIRVQYGGEGAEKAFSKLFKKLKKSVKF